MGVHGLTPFLRKACPTVIRNLSERFQSLRGKRVVIDGTLITQRFHFIQDKHPYQHIISWYKFAQELKGSDVSAICIFDGKTRNRAKAREAQRRRDLHEREVTRASVEQDRFTRLSRIESTLHSFEQLPDEGRQKVSDLLTSDPSFGDTESSILLQDHIFHETVEPASLEELLTPLQDHQTPALTGDDLNLKESVTAQTTNVSEIASEIKSSFLSFRTNVAKLVTLSVDQRYSPPSNLSPSSDEGDAAESVMSKSQHGLTANEGEFWKDCINALTNNKVHIPNLRDEVSKTSPRNQLKSLVDRSCMMLSMYERRINLPTEHTYKQSREILEALGVRCIQVEGAYEAEALASSMVLAGLADYVVSEDTDVLVYEAPLIRNMTARDPFIVSGADVRQTLELTRDEYVDFAILLGTDFSQRITGIGPVRALNLIKELGCIEKVVDSIESQAKYHLKLPKAAYLAQVDIARSVFKTLPAPPSCPLESGEGDKTNAATILKFYGIDQRDIDIDWRYDEALVGNYFKDNPIAA